MMKNSYLGAVLLFACSSLLSCQNSLTNTFALLSSNSEYVTATAHQDINLKEAPRQIDINLDASGNGLVSAATLGTYSYAIQNYEYQWYVKPSYSFNFLPFVIWQKPGKGEMIFLFSDTIIPGLIGPSLPAEKLKEPLALSTLLVDAYQSNGQATKLDFKQTGKTFTSFEPHLDPEGSGYSNVVVRPRVYLTQREANEYQIGTIPIEKYRLQSQLSLLPETFKSVTLLPYANFNEQNGMLIYQNTEQKLILKEIKQHQLQAEEQLLESDIKFYQPFIDQNGNGQILTDAAKKPLMLHTIENFKLKDQQKLQVELPAGFQRQYFFKGNKGFILAHTYPNATGSEIQMQLIEVENNQAKGRQKWRYSLDNQYFYGIQMQINEKGNGLIVIGTGSKGGTGGKLKLFQVANFQLK